VAGWIKHAGVQPRYGGVCQLTVTSARINTLTCPTDTINDQGVPNSTNPSMPVSFHNYVVNFGSFGYYQQVSVAPNGAVFSNPYPPGAWNGAPFSDSEASF